MDQNESSETDHPRPRLQHPEGNLNALLLETKSVLANSSTLIAQTSPATYARNIQRGTRSMSPLYYMVEASCVVDDPSESCRECVSTLSFPSVMHTFKEHLASWERPEGNLQRNHRIERRNMAAP